MSSFFYQIHGYKSGHQLLSENIRLSRMDQDCIDRLSDISGALRPDELFEPYLTCYPLPSAGYFVIGRTWQDLSVPRAGCVLTKSLLIPMEDWVVSKDVQSLFRIVSNASPDKNESFDFELKPTTSVPVATGIPAQELVEALFLENRQPVVVFDCPNKENILIRLYSTFWTSLRSGFSSCTFALSQRSLGGKPFDLLFAPSSVRSKFTEWQGRRIEALVNNNKASRRRWTEELARNIFVNPTPTLLTKGTETIVQQEGNTDESTLKLNLLWNELLFKAETESSPFAILGLLDIINSQPVFVTELYKNLRPYILNAIQNATIKLELFDAWKFYAALLVKHRRKQMDREMLSAVKKQCAVLTELDTAAAIDFINQYTHPSNSIPSVLFAGIGDGLATHLDYLNDIVKGNGPSRDIFVSLLASSKKLTQEIAFNFKKQSNYAFEFLSDAFTSFNKKHVVKAKKNFSQYITEDFQSELLSLVCDNVDASVYKVIISNLGKNTGFSVREFDPVIIKTTEFLYQFDFLKDTIEQFDKSGKADVLLATIIRKEPAYLSWFLFNSSVAIDRKIFIIEEVFNNIYSKTIEVLANDKNLSTFVIDLLLKEDVSPALVASVVSFANIPITRALAILIDLPARSFNAVGSRMLSNFLLRAFSVETITEEDISKFLNKIDDSVLVELLYEWTSNQYPVTQVLKGLKTVLFSDQKVYKVLYNEIVWVSRFLSNNLGNEITNDLAIKWSSLLRESKDQKGKYIEAAGIMMNFAYQLKSFDPRVLLETSFPAVYKTFLHDGPLSYVLPFLFFTDWDKCKTLRQDLVKRYLKSDWSPYGLFEIAYEANILKEVLSILFESEKGKKFIEEALDEMRQNKIRHPFVKELKRFF